MPAVEQYLKPKSSTDRGLICAPVHRQRLSARAARQPVSWLLGRVQRASQIHGRRRSARTSTGWSIAKTDKYYVKKFEAETNITGYLVMDLSRSMGYTYRQELTKFDYAICLAAALCYLMIHQQDPGGSDHVRRKDPQQPCRPSPSARSWATCSRCWRNLKPTGQDRHRQEPDANRRHACGIAAW